MPVTMDSSRLRAEIEAESGRDRLRWTRSMMQVMDEAGLFDDGDYELIDGDIVHKMKNKPHSFGVKILTMWLNRIFGEEFVQVQDPLPVSNADNRYNYLEPDLAVFKNPVLSYKTTDPVKDDVLLVVEVTDSTMRRDWKDKALLYARAEFPEYWSLDLKRRRLIVHRHPLDGAYTDVAIYAESESAAPLARPTAFVTVADLLPDSDLIAETAEVSR